MILCLDEMKDGLSRWFRSIWIRRQIKWYKFEEAIMLVDKIMNDVCHLKRWKITERVDIVSSR